LEKGPGNLGPYPFLKIHGYPVCIYIRIRSQQKSYQKGN
jgi:hypothetical protein